MTDVSSRVLEITLKGRKRVFAVQTRAGDEELEERSAALSLIEEIDAARRLVDRIADSLVKSHTPITADTIMAEGEKVAERAKKNMEPMSDKVKARALKILLTAFEKVAKQEIPAPGSPPL